VLSTAVAAMQEEQSFIMIDTDSDFLKKGIERFDEMVESSVYNITVDSNIK